MTETDTRSSDLTAGAVVAGLGLMVVLGALGLLFAGWLLAGWRG